MLFYTHNKSSEIDINGTSLQGQINCGYHTLRALFGEPMEGDSYKVDAEWHIYFVHEGFVATIYNWKNGRNYLGGDGTPTAAIRDWNIGGNSPRSAELVQQVISEALA